jgi:hypothetical protein
MLSLHKRIKVIWIEEKGLHALLILLAAQIFLIFPFLGKAVVFRIILVAFYGALLYVGLLQHTRAKKPALVWGITGLIFCMAVIAELAGRRWMGIANDALIILYAVALASIVLIRTLGPGPINVYRIEGSIVAFLLIGLVFCFLNDLIFLVMGPTAYRGLSSGDKKEFMYFSLTTLTTVGYGDITPALPASRSAANLEALIGQLYPAILIARLVSKEISSSGAA